MRRSTLLLLPVIIILASCGTASQYAQQQFSDGVYVRPDRSAVQIASYASDRPLYTKEDFVAMAAQNIAAKNGTKSDTLVVVLDDRTTWGLYNDWRWNDWVWNLGFSSFWGPFNWSWRWHNSFWFDPFWDPIWDPYWDFAWGGWGSYWGSYWYGPGWYNPGWYGPGWGGNVYYAGAGFRPHESGFDYSGGIYHGSRMSTQSRGADSVTSRSYGPGSAGSTHFRPGSSSSSTKSMAAGGSNYRASGSGSYRASGSAVPANERTGSGYNYVRRSTQNNAQQNYSRSSSQSMDNGRASNYNNSVRSSGASGFSGGGFSGGGMGGGNASHSGGGGGGSHGGGGRR